MRTGPGNPDRPQVPEEVKTKIVKLYVEDGLTYVLISKRLGVSRNTVSEVLKARNVKINRSARFL